MCLQLGFLIFCQKEIGAKAARKMLVKFTESVFICLWLRRLLIVAQLKIDSITFRLEKNKIQNLLAVDDYWIAFKTALLEETSNDNI